jgi:predicted dehydrogenase
MKKDLNSADPIRLGILGAGLAVKWLHWPSLRRLSKEYTITQICDVDRDAATATAEMVGGAPTTIDYRDLLANPRVEAVLISLPIHLNAQMITEAARAGKHVICEKPLAASLPQAQALVRALEGVPVVVGIAENYHYRPGIVQAREWIAAGRIGQVFLVAGEGVSWTDPGSGFGSTPWRQDSQYRGDVLTDGGVHNAAGLRELGGEVEQLQAFTKDVHPVMAGEDTMVLNLRFRNGALGSLILSGAAKASSDPRPEFRVFGTEGSIVVTNKETRLLRPAKGDPNGQEVAEVFAPPEEDAGGYYGEFQDFYAAVREGRPTRVPLAEALRDFEIIMRALDSAESRQVVLL